MNRPMSLAGLRPAGLVRSGTRALLGPALSLRGFALDACSVYDDLRVGPAQTRAVQAPAAVSGEAGAPPPLVAAGSPAVDPSSVEPVACAQLASDSPCERLPRLTRTPNVDGELDCGLSLVTLPAAAGATERFVHYAAAYSDAGLYLFVRVQGAPATPHAPDQALFCGDAVELFVDADGVLDPLGSYESTGTLQFVVAAPRPSGGGIEAAKFLQGKPFGPWISTALKVATFADGYAVEALISAADLGLWSWRPVGQLGFDVAVDFALSGAALDPTCSSARTQTFLRLASREPPCAGQPWCDTRSFCVPQLLQ